MNEKKIVIIGGSIAGCAIGVLLQKLGLKFVILEKSSGKIGSGSGITLPEDIIKQCMVLDLFDINIPRLSIKSRTMLRKENESSKTFWTQSIHLNTLNWMHVYENLRKRIDPKNYCVNTEVVSIKKFNDVYCIETTKKMYEADLVIAADGIDSLVRAQLFPGALSQYAGYVAWRGVIDESKLFDNKFFENNIPYYFFPGGHILLYKIPSKNYINSGHKLLNWVMYEDRRGKSVEKFLTAKDGKQHTRSLPVGTLSQDHLSYLKEFSKKVLPKEIDDIIRKTEHPFIQAVFDFQQSQYKNHSVIFVGDAAITLRPHTASGVLKALSNAITLYRLLKSNANNTLDMLVSRWIQEQNQINSEETPKAKAMGDGLVTNSPDWSTMDHEKTTQWWNKLMSGKRWYATDLNYSNFFFNTERQTVNIGTKFVSKL